MALPTLADWQRTSRALHQATMLLGPIQNALFAPRKNYLHLAMHIQPNGLSSPILPRGGRVEVDFVQGAVVYHRAHGAAVMLKLAEHTQQTLFEALLNELKHDELAAFLADAGSGSLAKELIDKLNAISLKTAFLALADLQHTDPLIYEPQDAHNYADVLYTMFTGVARFRARLEGHMTPIVVWAEHFDLSTLWFHPGNAAMDDTKAHMNFGFAPFSTGYERPYLYVYIYPYPDPFELPVLPEPAIWHTAGWTGVVVNYDDMATQSNAAQFVETTCLDLFKVLSPFLHMEATP
ncbi:MAG: hypothetical protein GYB65_03220 [Chloroflexi bacterium]|nr:hypothetical protein [Chloroflexota bacterium]